MSAQGRALRDELAEILDEESHPAVADAVRHALPTSHVDSDNRLVLDYADTVPGVKWLRRVRYERGLVADYLVSMGDPDQEALGLRLVLFRAAEPQEPTETAHKR